VLPAAQSVIDMQVIQDAAGGLRILVVQRDSPAAERDRAHIAKTFEVLVAPRVAPRVERVDQIALTPGGKLRTIMSEMES
jgi:hypothetical protein